MTGKTYKLDIFNVLNKISTKDRNFYSSLSDEEQKSIAPFVIMRWLSGTRDIRQIVFLNELVNPFVFEMSHHKSLIMDLLTISSSGKSQRYSWNKTHTRKSSKTPVSASVLREYYGYSSIQAEEALPLLTLLDVISLAEQLGRQSEDITVIKKELKDRERASISM